ncbi:hypothetical protein OC842_001681 [Tilletia horrida]|uniref:C-CAP/cofactor C-like domain-containing protein n=1 Tax=Tilletia horrida TaxID=155126 RepID=A0AAN6JM08_9BASI|nr:hypothetical protein OC842_001681 [Tilletia horrida]
MTSTSSLGASSALSATHAASFFTAFRARLAALSDRIDADESTDALVQELAEARKALLDETAQIPPRDREGHERVLRELSERLATRSKSTGEVAGTAGASQNIVQTSQAKPRFAFKRSAPSKPAASIAQTASSKVPDAATMTAGTGPANTLNPALSSSDLRLENRSDAILDLRTHANSKSVLLTIQIRSLSNCIVLIPPLQGSVMVHGCKGCLIVVEQCRQYRMHDTTASTIILSDCLTGATIENCRQILFGASLDRLKTRTTKFTVQDFDHVSSIVKSPNWRWLVDEDEEPQSALSKAQTVFEQLHSPVIDTSSTPAHEAREQLLSALSDIVGTSFSSAQSEP